MAFNMDYEIFCERFKKKGKKNPDGKFYFSLPDQKIFPFTQRDENIIKSETYGAQLAGTFLCNLKGKYPEVSDSGKDDFFYSLFEDEEVEAEDVDYFVDVLRSLYLYDNSNYFKPVSMNLLEQNYAVKIPKVNNAIVINMAEYLASVLVDKDNVQDIFKHIENNPNLLEKFILRRNNKSIPIKYESYKRIVYFLQKPFENDFAYVMKSSERINEYLCDLLKLYSTLYTSYALLQLSKISTGTRYLSNDDNDVLYFSFDDDKVDDSRKAYKYGYHKMERIADKIFAYSLAISALNTSDESEIYDFIDIVEKINRNEWSKTEVINKVKCFCEDFEVDSEVQNILNINEKIKKLKNDIIPNDNITVHQILKYLISLMNLYLLNTDRKDIILKIKSVYKSLCRDYVKGRGKWGNTFNISPEQLTMLTKFIIPEEQDNMRLNELFNQFEARGIFFEEKSKEKIALYYDKLNLIQKKSDSGDAQYVRRII